MRSILLTALLLLATNLSPALAQDRVFLGWGRLFTNDALGDGHDRWRTGSSTLSLMWGPRGTMEAPARPGAVVEFRFATEILAPENLVAPAAWDRRYAGLLSAGVYTHFASGAYEFSAGGGVVAAGPMTGLAHFHDTFHGAFGLAGASRTVRAAQFANALYPVVQLEIARPVALAEGTVLRPFAEARAGDETFLRVGADLLIGPNFSSGVLVRDGATGIPYQTLGNQAGTGLSFLLGGDTARVFGSAWLPASGGITRTALRNRLRAGVQWQSAHFGVFYGATWLGPEVTAQPEGQVVGSLQLRVRF